MRIPISVALTRLHRTHCQPQCKENLNFRQLQMGYEQKYLHTYNSVIAVQIGFTIETKTSYQFQEFQIHQAYKMPRLQRKMFSREYHNGPHLCHKSPNNTPGQLTVSIGSHLLYPCQDNPIRYSSLANRSNTPQKEDMDRRCCRSLDNSPQHNTIPGGNQH
jgi:hypothetical protein